MNLRAALVIALILGTVISGWMAWNNRVQPDATTQAQRSDYVLYDFELVALNDQGQERMTLRAPRLERQPGNESLDLQTPLFLLPDGNGHHWELSAKTGWISAEGDELILREDVLGRSPEQGDMPDTRISTDTLTVLPDQNLARTDAAVRLSQPGLVQTGVGMELDTATRNLRLLSQVKTRYEPAAAR